MSTLSSSVLLLVLMSTAGAMADSAVNFHTDVQFYWGNELADVLDDGESLTMSLDNSSGCAFNSYNAYLFGRFDMLMKLIPDNSAGTVTTYYLTSLGSYHDEIDFEFLGNLTGQPYICHTNIFANGTGGREQEFYLWFDPTADYHKYSVVWNSLRIILLVDDVPIRLFNNNEAIGVPFPTAQEMNICGSVWCGESWATDGGAVKTNWSYAPFTASYKNLTVCDQDYSSGSSSSTGYSCSNSTITSTEALEAQELDSEILQELAWVQDNYQVYDYCTDTTRWYPTTTTPYPLECNQPRFNR